MIQSWDVLSTMTPADYLSFRDALGRSSGFQSYQYRLLEFALGNKDRALLAPHRAAGGIAPAGRVPSLPGAGSLLMPPWEIRRFDAELVEVGVQFSRYHVGGNNVVHGGMVAMMFDVMCGIIIHAIGRPISRTAFLHVDYRNITPIDVPLTVRGWASKAEGRKTFVNAELTDADGTLLAEANGLMVQLLPGQP